MCGQDLPDMSTLAPYTASPRVYACIATYQANPSCLCYVHTVYIACIFLCRKIKGKSRDINSIYPWKQEYNWLYIAWEHKPLIQFYNLYYSSYRHTIMTINCKFELISISIQYGTKLWRWKSLTNLTNKFWIVKIFPTKILHLVLYIVYGYKLTTKLTTTIGKFWIFVWCKYDFDNCS